MRQLRTAGAEIAGGVYNNITTVQRSSLGYASYDQYYGPDRAKTSKRDTPKRPESGAPKKPTRDVTPTVEPASANGSGAPRREKAPASTPGEQAER